MLQLSALLLNRPVLSLRTGTMVATAIGPIINPVNLKIEGFYCEDSQNGAQLVLVNQDIRDIIPPGIVVNDHDVLADPADLVRLRQVMQAAFDPIGKQVITVSKEKVGKVSDYATEVESMYIQKLYITQSLLKSFTGGNIGIDRTQIVEITHKQIIINDLAQKVPAHANAVA